MKLPHEMVIEILSWLPPKSLLRFKCVCKSWSHRFTNDSDFTKLQSQRGFKRRDRDETTWNARHILRVVESVAGLAGKPSSDFYFELDYHLRKCPTLVLAPIYGFIFAQIRLVKRNCYGDPVGIGCPSYVCDELESQAHYNWIKSIILVDVDEMLLRGFKDKIFQVLKLLPSNMEVKVLSSDDVTGNEPPDEKRALMKSKLSKAFWVRRELTCTLQEKRMEIANYEKKWLQVTAAGNSKKKENKQDFVKRKKRSTISWNPHLKRHM